MVDSAIGLLLGGLSKREELVDGAAEASLLAGSWITSDGAFAAVSLLLLENLSTMSLTTSPVTVSLIGYSVALDIDSFLAVTSSSSEQDPLTVEDLPDISRRVYLNFFGLPPPLYLLCMPLYDRFVPVPRRVEVRKTSQVSAEGGVCGGVFREDTLSSSSL